MNEFNGFDEPTSNYSKLPHQLIDNLSIIKSSGELKAILYVLRHTWGFGEYEDWQVKQITTDEFINGRKKSDGQRLDGGIKVSKPTLYKGLDEAVEHGFLVRYVDNTDLGRVTHYYRLRSPDDTESVLYATDPDRPGTSPWHTIDKEIKDRVYKRFQGRCAYCEGKSRKWHYDHIVPLAQGGPSEFENLALSCPPCNLTKSNRTPDQWGRQVVFYDENDVKKVYRGWSNFFTGGGKDSLPRTEKETKKEKEKKETDSEKSFYLAVSADVENKLGIMPTPILENSIKEAMAIFPEQWITAAIDKAAQNKARSWRYVEVVLEKWQLNGKQDELPSPNGDHSLPDNLDTTMFQIAWEKWKQHMAEKRRPLTPTSTEASLQELSEWGEERAIEAINFSVRRGWLSINEDEKQPPEQSDQPYKGWLPGKST